MSLADDVVAFRGALVSVARRDRLLLRSFPRGCCGTASEMLAYFLWTRRNTIASLVSAERSGAATVQTHAWLELAGDVIDITADQFATWDGATPYVGRRTPWHAQWDVVSSRPFTSCDTTQMLATWLYPYELTLAALACPG